MKKLQIHTKLVERTAHGITKCQKKKKKKKKKDVEPKI